MTKFEKFSSAPDISAKPEKRGRSISKTGIERIENGTPAEFPRVVVDRLSQLASFNPSTLDKDFARMYQRLMVADKAAAKLPTADRLEAGLRKMQKSEPEMAARIIDVLSSPETAEQFVEWTEAPIDIELKEAGLDTEINKLKTLEIETETQKKAKRGKAAPKISSKELHGKEAEEVRKVAEDEDVINLKEGDYEIVEEKAPESRKRISRPPELKTRELKGKEAEEIREMDEDERKTASLREQISAPKGKDVFHRASVFQARADLDLRAFERDLRAGNVTSKNREQYTNKFRDLLDQFESIQTQLLQSSSKDLVKRAMNENYQRIGQIEAALRASTMNPQRALAELTHGKGVRAYEMEKEGLGRKSQMEANALAAQIEKETGMTPEEIQSGGGLKGMWYRMSQRKNLTAYRNLLMNVGDAEEARMGREFHEKTDVTTARNVERREQEEREEAKEEQEKKMEASYAGARSTEQQANRDMAVQVLGRETAMQLWTEVNDKMIELQRMDPSKKFSFSAEDYVVKQAQYFDAVQNKRRGGEQEYSAELDSMREELENFMPPIQATDRTMPVQKQRESVSRRRARTAREERRRI